ncbi:MAG: zf-HC2 domain-containing protein [Candidatus Limnocylindrales bacterium]
MTRSRAGDHERARDDLALRLDEPLDPLEGAWLQAHLAGCAACRGLDEAYRADRAALRAIEPAVVPRDLWARTAAALDAEDAARDGRRKSRERRRVASRGPASPLSGRPGLAAALAAFVVVALVGWTVGIGWNGRGSSPQAGAAAPTPIVVVGGDVAWLTTSVDGTYTLNQAAVRQVCADTAPSACRSIDAGARSVVLPDVAPRSIYASPARSQVVVVGRSPGSMELTMYVMDVGTLAAATPTPTAAATPARVEAPSAVARTPPATSLPAPTSSLVAESIGPGGSAASAPTVETPIPSPTIATPIPMASGVLAIASDLTILGETAAYSSDGSWFAFTARPAAATTGSDIYAWQAGQPVAVAITTDHRSVFSSWAGGMIVGSRAGGAGSAVSTVPAPSGSPDLASVPAATATPTPTETPTPPTATATPAPAETSTPPGSSPLFGSTTSSASPVVEVLPSAFLIDPATRTELDLPTPAWRPLVDPTGTLVAYWAGTVSLDATTGEYTTATGSLVVGSWPALEAGAVLVPPPPPAPDVTAASPLPGDLPSPTASPTTSPTASPTASLAAPVDSSPLSIQPSATPSIAPSASPFGGPLPTALGSVSGVPWDVQWDETGRQLAIWAGDPTNPSVGRLAMITIDPTTGLVDPTGPAVTDGAVLPGIAIGQGHLAWATPPGPAGQGSRLVVYAWTGADPGRVDSQAAPGSATVVVVQH